MKIVWNSLVLNHEISSISVLNLYQNKYQVFTISLDLRYLLIDTRYHGRNKIPTQKIYSTASQKFLIWSNIYLDKWWKDVSYPDLFPISGLSWIISQGTNLGDWLLLIFTVLVSGCDASWDLWVGDSDIVTIFITWNILKISDFGLSPFHRIFHLIF